MITPTDVDVRRYLLSQLTEEQTAAIDQALFADWELVSRVSELEHEMVDAYIAGELTTEDRAQFERHYLASPAHRERVEVARTLRAWTLATEAPASRARPFRLGWLGWSAAAAILIIAVAIWGQFGGAAPPREEQAVAPPAAAPDARPSPDAPARDASRGSPATQPPGEPVTVALMLSPVQTRGAGETPQLTIPAGVDRVELRIPGDDLDGLDAQIRSVDTEAVWTGTVQGGAEARVIAPATSLPPGDYILTLSRRGSSVSRYYFRVLREG